MRIVQFTDARRELRSELDIVAKTNKETVIKSIKNQVILMSKERYEFLLNKIKELESKNDRI